MLNYDYTYTTLLAYDINQTRQLRNSTPEHGRGKILVRSAVFFSLKKCKVRTVRSGGCYVQDVTPDLRSDYIGRAQEESTS